jgi:3-hydroxyacyl-CoA dehydrogenase/enoyl-CoA hydratase/3-hydroxybutyryl-CoA epimerase
VVVKDSPGFLVNRILAPYLSEAVRLVKDGCRIEEVDRVLTDFGMPVGPLALLDDIGLDVAVKAGEVLQAAFPDRMKAAGDEALAAAGRLGRKSGGGFYDYRDGKRLGASNRAYEILGVEPAKASPIAAGEIEARLVLLMVNEAAMCLSESVVSAPAKLDLAMLFGTGFPPFRGGVLRYADALGPARVVSALEDLASRRGTRFQPAALLLEMARSGAKFYRVGNAKESPEDA